MPGKNFDLSYLITVSKAHLQPALFLLRTLRLKTNKEIVVVGNLDEDQVDLIKPTGAKYIDENGINLSGRLPKVSWKTKYRDFGWYKQKFIRWSIDRFMNTKYVAVIDSEVFVFDNWNENNFFSKTGQPRYFYWISKKKKPDWDYQMYRGSAYVLKSLPGCEHILKATTFFPQA